MCSFVVSRKPLVDRLVSLECNAMPRKNIYGYPGRYLLKKNLLIIGSSKRRRGHAGNGNRWCKQDEEEVREEGHFNVKEVILK